jgi:hypothetical protein
LTGATLFAILWSESRRLRAVSLAAEDLVIKGQLQKGAEDGRI